MDASAGLVTLEHFCICILSFGFLSRTFMLICLSTQDAACFSVKEDGEVYRLPGLSVSPNCSVSRRPSPHISAPLRARPM